MLTGVYALVGLVLLVAAVPLAAGRIRPNPYYGFRTPRVNADERLWYPVNRVAGRTTAVLGLAFLGLAGLLAGGLGTTGLLLGTFGSLALWAVSTLVGAARAANRVDASGPAIDYRSSFQKQRDHDAGKAREKLLEKLR